MPAYRLTAALISAARAQMGIAFGQCSAGAGRRITPEPIGGDEAVMSTLGLGYRPRALPRILFSLRCGQYLAEQLSGSASGAGFAAVAFVRRDLQLVAIAV